MQITFYGGVREVTGSMHLLVRGEDRILLDCGMFQGRRRESEEKNRVFPFDPGIVTNLVVSHAHIDHSGRIPVLTRNDFRGRIVCTRATSDACAYLLEDAAKIQESDAQYLNYKTVRSLLYEMEASGKKKGVSAAEREKIRQLLKRGSHQLNEETIHELMDRFHLHRVMPLYTTEDATKSLSFFDGYPYKHPVNVGSDMTCTFYEAGHILGSAITIIQTRENGRVKTLGYTGDMGRFEKPIIRDPAMVFREEDREIDLLVMESTYGDRVHEPVANNKQRLARVLTETVSRGGTVLIPAFAYGRTQEMLYLLHELYLEGRVPKVPIFVDSPLATKITRVYAEHPEAYDRKAHETFLENGKNPFVFDQVQFTESVEDSMAVMREEKPHILIASSGMCEAGRILHHLRYKIHQPRNTVLVVGFMAEHTLGRRILEQGKKYEDAGRKGDPPMVRILNKEYPLKARVVSLEGFSAHGDRNEMLRFLKESNLRIKKIALVHGEQAQSLAFAKFLEKEGFQAAVPQVGQTFLVA